MLKQAYRANQTRESAHQRVRRSSAEDTVEHISLWCNYAYRFLNRHACELGDLAGMSGELEAVVLEGIDADTVTIPAMARPGKAQLTAAFGRIIEESVAGSTIHTNCDAGSIPAVRRMNCGCIAYNGVESPGIGSIDAFRPVPNPPFTHAGTRLRELEGKSIVVQCGSTFGEDKRGLSLLCAALK